MLIGSKEDCSKIVLCLCEYVLSQLNVSFLFLSPRDSLSELREYTVSLAGSEREEQEHGSPQASGAPGQSVISLLSPQELAKLIEEVKSLDEATLKVNLLFLFVQGFQKAVEWMCLVNLCNLILQEMKQPSQYVPVVMVSSKISKKSSKDN